MPTRIFEVSAAPVNLLAANDLEGNPLDLQVGTHLFGPVRSTGAAVDTQDGGSPNRHGRYCRRSGPAGANI